ncbi:hypothetical protein NKR23_g9462 [Pleurostoma richardsiae]|uniref:Uncharacterized protein n=1 Tax=Pleurostoma richardsiae TaxID=41990 RepID=A0AA38VJW8_9PEZI|nr:hypothetical protein NKR23_g9462 [Pleurostoma richardsiae]
MADDITPQDRDEYINYQLKLQHMSNVAGFLGNGVRTVKDMRIREQLEAEKRMAERPVKWVWVMEPSNPACTHVVEVIVDVWADKSFIPESLAKNFNLAVSREETPVEHCVLSGDTFVTDKSTEVSLIGKNMKTYSNKFYMLPPKQQDMDKVVVGREFIETVDDFLLDEDPSPRPAYWTAQKKPNAQEAAQVNAARRQADADYALLARNKEEQQNRTKEKLGDGVGKAAAGRRTDASERSKKT